MRAAVVLRVLFAAYVAATALHIGYVLAHEPFSFDAWNMAVDTKSEPATVGNFFDYWGDQYAHSNPRIGQALTYLAYKVDRVAEVSLAVSFLAITLAVTVLALGRWPFARGRDLALWAVAIGFGWFAFPQIGRNLFCRAYGANYVFGAAVQLWFLVPLRLASESRSAGRDPRPNERAGEGRGDQSSGRRAGPVSTVKCLAYGVLGVAAGMANEHTGPTLLVFLAGYGFWLHRKGQRSHLLFAGAAGAAVGFLAIFFAPGQGERYDGLAQQVGFLQRMMQRGLGANLEIVRDYLEFAVPLLLLIVLVLALTKLGGDRRRDALRFIALAIVAGLLVSATLFVSPKLGSRFFLVPMALLLAGTIALIDAAIEDARVLAIFVGIALFASGYAAARTIPLFTRVAAQGEARMAGLAAAPPGSTFVADAFEQIDETWWFIGDDFRDLAKRQMVARYLGLDRVVYRGFDQRAPLGTMGIHLVLRGPSGERALDLDVRQPLEVHELHEALRRALPRIAEDRSEVTVVFSGPPPALPRPRLVVARYASGSLEAYTARVTRRGRSRVVQLPRDLGGREVHVVQVGGESRPLPADGTWTPWRAGVYWVLACDRDVCWVIGATRAG